MTWGNMAIRRNLPGGVDSDVRGEIRRAAEVHASPELRHTWIKYGRSSPERVIGELSDRTQLARTPGRKREPADERWAEVGGITFSRVGYAPTSWATERGTDWPQVGDQGSALCAVQPHSRAQYIALRWCLPEIVLAG